MAINFCVNCGSKLEDNVLVCGTCGEPVPESLVYKQEVNSADNAVEPETSNAPTETVEEEDFQQYADLSGFDIIGTYPAIVQPKPKPLQPDRTDIMPPVGGMGAATEYRAPQQNTQPKPKRTGKIILGAAAALIALAGIGLVASPNARAVLAQRLAPSSEVSTAESAQPVTPTSIAEVGTVPGVRDARASVDEDAAFDQLVTTYDKLQSYNERVYSCIQTYNSVIVVQDRNQREAAANIASALLDEIALEQETIDALGIGRASDLYDDYSNVTRLLNDQYQRLAVVVESWNISLRYNNPYDHQDQILEPLRRDIGATGVNTYLEDFDEHYWNSRPQR